MEYDHNWVLDGDGYPADVSAKAPAGHYAAFTGRTLETQTFPDAVHHSHFPQRVLRPGHTYLHRMRFDFSAVCVPRLPASRTAAETGSR